MTDGTVFAGISPDTSKPIYTSPADVSFTLTFTEAIVYAHGLIADEAHGYDDGRLPTKAELNLLFNNRAAIDGFDDGSDSMPNSGTTR